MPVGDKVEGIGTAGTPVGGVVTVQGPAAPGGGSPAAPLQAAQYVFNSATGLWVPWRDMSGGDSLGAASIGAIGVYGQDPAGTFDIIRGDSTKGLEVHQHASDLQGRVQSATNTAATLTLAAAGAGLFHYITEIRCRRGTTAAVAGTTALSITCANLPIGATLAFFGNFIAVGTTQIDYQAVFSSPIKSSVANTNTTISYPACGAGVISEIVVSYYTGP